LHRGYTLPLALLVVVAIALIVSAIGPTDRLTWWLSGAGPDRAAADSQWRGDSRRAELLYV
jgi:hypothetical protein